MSNDERLASLTPEQRAIYDAAYKEAYDASARGAFDRLAGAWIDMKRAIHAALPAWLRKMMG